MDGSFRTILALASTLLVTTQACTCEAVHSADAGAADSGADSRPEACDGLDNDLDGIVDDGPDGGALEVLCPLQFGVCAGAVSPCIDGGWTRCAYGADYERTETRCDQLDNDCDGRVDVSWARVLLAGDAGTVIPGELWILDFWQLEVIATPGGLWLSTPTRLISLSKDLESRGSIDFPGDPYKPQVSRVFPTRSGWFRIAAADNCLLGHEVYEDGGYPRLPTGELDPRGKACVSPFSPPVYYLPFAFGATQTDDGVAAYMQAVYADDLVWAWFGFDGGGLTGTLDAGRSISSYPPIADGRGWKSLIVVKNDTRSRAWRLTPPDPQLTPLFDVAVPFCRPATDAPFTYSCPEDLPSPRYWTWFDASGLPLTGPNETGWVYPLQTTDGGPALFAAGAVSPDRVVRLQALSDAGLRQWATVGTDAALGWIQLHPIQGRLMIATWPEGAHNGVCPACNAESLSAQYVCAPP